ncbi:hypothetical protein NFI96_025208 [Prochilodus magdalenae]|nr:hypothetical protein NFI96_025208 [Prochilodus magdalenae]
MSSDYLFELSDNDSDTSDMRSMMMISESEEEKSSGWLLEEPVTGLLSGNTSPREHCQEHGNGVFIVTVMVIVVCLCLSSSGMVCQRPFCHLYWGCQRIGCQGCLARFSDLNLTPKCLDGVINNNNYESEVLQNYLSSRGKTWREMLQEALQATQQGLYHLTGRMGRFKQEAAV